MTDPALSTEAAPHADGQPPSLPFPVVGVGASAGGLEAITNLLESLPPKPGLSLLVVLHLARDAASHLPEILSRVTPLTVRQAEHGMKVDVDSVYVIPPDKVMTILDGPLGLDARGPRPPHMPIDYLFRSLARVQKSKAVGVILSGEGTDGTLGFVDLKAEGGITFAQDEKSAAHDAMPRAAVADGCVDYVLPPAEIARELVRLTRHPYATSPPDGDHASGDHASADDAVNLVIGLLRSSTDVDF